VEDATKVGNMQQPNREEGFVEQRHKKWGGNRPIQPEKVWNRVGIITGNKFNLLAQDKQEQRKKVEKGDLNVVDTNVDTPGVQMSANKDKRSKFQDGIIDTEQAEENSHAGKKNIAKSGDIVDSSPGRKMGEYVIERGNDEVVSTKYSNEENNYEKKKDGTDCVSRDVLEKGLNSENENHRDEVESVIRKGPDLIDEDDDVLQQRKDLEEDEELEYNIQQISKAGDLSPRHTNSLKNGVRKGKKTIPLQVQTRSSRERASNSDQ